MAERKNRQGLNFIGDAGDDLGCRCARADDAYVLALQVDIVVPLCGMKALAFELVHARYFRHPRSR